MSERVYQPKSSAKEYRLGSWILCVHANCLRCGDIQVDLEHRLVLLLLLFIDRSGEVLSKEEILKTIWQGKVVNDDSLAVAISYLRKALGDNSRAPDYIKTIPGVGYQFIATAEPVIPTAEPVDTNPPSSLSLSVTDSVESIDNPLVNNRPANKKLWVIFFVAIIFLLVAGVLWWFKSGIEPLVEKLPVTQHEASHSLSTALQQQANQAQQAVNSDSADDWRLAIQLWRDVLNHHPHYPQAYAGIAEAKIRLLGDQLTLPGNCAEIMGLLDKAVALDAKFAAAYRWRGNVLLWCQRDYTASERDYQTAIALQPQNDATPMSYAQLLLAQGRFEESLVQINKSRQLNPLNYSVLTVVWMYQMQRRDDLALQELQRITSGEPDNRYHHISAHRVLTREGQEVEAWSHWLWLMQDADYSDQDLQAAQAAFDRGGLVEVNRWLLARKDDVDLGHYQPPLSWARYALVAGETEQALAYLEQALDVRQAALIWATVDPAYDPVRDHPRFRAIIAALQKPISEK